MLAHLKDGFDWFLFLMAVVVVVEELVWRNSRRD